MNIYIYIYAYFSICESICIYISFCANAALFCSVLFC